MPESENRLDPDEDLQRLRRAFFGIAAFVGLLWLIKLAELGLDLQLHGLTNFPRRMDGLPGVAFAPLLHGSIEHLFANTLPLLVLGTALFYGYPKAARIVLPVIWVGSGLAVWLFARPAFHLGASGLTFGMMFFLFTIGALRWDPRAIALSLAVFFLYGGMIWGVFPSKPNISFEYHLAGAALGITLALLLKDRDPPPPKKVYDWEGQDIEDDDWPEDGAWPNDEPVKRHAPGQLF